MKYVGKKDLVMPKRGMRKGDNGRVLVIGGSENYVGAVVLAGLAVLRSGADWVTVAVPEKVGWAVNALSPDLVVKKFKGNHFSEKHVNVLLKEGRNYDVILIGNGIGLKSGKFVKSFIKKSEKPLVIDADALKFVSLRSVRNSILTPHRREYEILLENSNLRGKDVKKYLRDNVIVLKGKIDEIICSEGVCYNKTGNAGMTKAGTGDVLAGLATGFFAQIKDNVKAAKMATYYNGLIGDLLLKKKKGFTYLASDMVDEIEKIMV